MNNWIFQSVPDRYDLRDKLIAGKNATWYATRYRSKMQPDDLVFFWLGGPPPIRGIYGWGGLTSKAYIKPKWDSYGVDVKYVQKLASHLSVTTIKAVPILEDMLILRAAQATNFLLSEEETEAIIKLLPNNQRPN